LNDGTYEEKMPEEQIHNNGERLMASKREVIEIEDWVIEAIVRRVYNRIYDTAYSSKSTLRKIVKDLINSETSNVVKEIRKELNNIFKPRMEEIDKITTELSKKIYLIEEKIKVMEDNKR